MKITKIISILILAVITVSCSSTKKNMDDSLYNATWELEYISGPKIAFSGLYPDKKPKITFDKASNKVDGTASCNGYSAEYTLSGNNISFGEPGPATKMYCGEGEKIFLNSLQKVNKFKIDRDGKLNLMMGDISILRFKKFSVE